MEGNARIWFTPQQRAELWERWRSGQCVADIARALERSGRRAIQQRFGLPNGHRIYAASLAQAGQIEEARAELALLQELHPENSIAWVEQNIPLNPGRMAKLVEGLRKAGMQ